MAGAQHRQQLRLLEDYANPMTVIDELLVLLDDGVARTLDECVAILADRTRQTLSSTLGRLAAKGWVKVERDRLREANVYTITPDGQGVVTRTLEHLRLSDDESWKNHWLFVLFNIPERERKYRDILRNRLSSIGFGRVQNSVWVTARDVRFEFQDLLDIATIKRSTTVIYPLLSKEESRQLADAFEWNWTTLNKGYKQFIHQAEAFLEAESKQAFSAKRIVYYYAKLLSQDPKFPSFLEPRNYERQAAHKKYEQVRPYCYEEA